MKKESCCRKVRSNLLAQNVYLRDVLPVSQSHASVVAPSTFESIDEVCSSDGIRLVSSVHPYPITQESVNSYLSSTDYRLDPLVAASSKPSSPNLGDVSYIQQFNALSSEEKRRVYSELSSRFSKELLKTDSSTVVSENVEK